MQNTKTNDSNSLGKKKNTYIYLNTESKESVEITDLGKHKKRVGIHTDITFEITSEADGNETSSAQQHGDKGECPFPSVNFQFNFTFPRSSSPTKQDQIERILNTYQSTIKSY